MLTDFFDASAAQIIVEQQLRRALSPQPMQTSREFRSKALGPWLRWLGLWVLDSLVATYGIVLALNLTVNVWESLMGKALMIRLVLTPYYPFTLFFALLVGYWGYPRFNGSYRSWVWVLLAASLLYSVGGWRGNNRTSWSVTLFHFFGFLPYPDNHDQLDSSLLLYVSIAYILGAWLHEMAGRVGQRPCKSPQ